MCEREKVRGSVCVGEREREREREKDIEHLLRSCGRAGCDTCKFLNGI